MLPSNKMFVCLSLFWFGSMPISCRRRFLQQIRAFLFFGGGVFYASSSGSIFNQHLTSGCKPAKPHSALAAFDPGLGCGHVSREKHSDGSMVSAGNRLLREDEMISIWENMGTTNNIFDHLGKHGNMREHLGRCATWESMGHEQKLWLWK